MAGVFVVIDNDSLTHLAYIDQYFPIVDRLKSIFTAIHIPDEILAEFEHHHVKNPERKKIIDEAYTSGKFFRKCSSFETISKAFLQTYRGIDKGEAAAAAQHQYIKSRYIISEDQRFFKSIRQVYPDLQIIKLKHVLAMLDLHGFMQDWAGCIKLLHQRRPFSTSELREAYALSAHLVGIDINKKRLSARTGFKKIGIPLR